MDKLEDSFVDGDLFSGKDKLEDSFVDEDLFSWMDELEDSFVDEDLFSGMDELEDSFVDEDLFSGMDNLGGPFVDYYKENELLDVSALLLPVNEPNTPAMHCGQKRQKTADSLEVGVSILAQKYRRVDNISFPHHRRNSPPISNQSDHTESDKCLGNHPTSEEINMPEGRAFESHKLNANTSQPLKNGMPCEDRCETSTKRNNQEKETHFEEQPTEIQRNNPVRQAIVETIEDHNIPNAITDHDVVDHPTHMGAQFSLASTSTQPLSSFSSIEKIKLDFDNLIALPLKVLMDPDNETSMKKVLVILKDNLSSFSEKQQGQILELCVDFPAFVLNWREWHSQSQIYRQQAETDRDLAGKDEESLRVRYEVLGNKEKELMRQLDEVQRQKEDVAEQRTEKSKLTKDLKEKEAARRNKEENLKRIATEKLNKLYDEWAKIQSCFI